MKKVYVRSKTDMNQWAKMVVDIATGSNQKEKDKLKRKNTPKKMKKGS